MNLLQELENKESRLVKGVNTKNQRVTITFNAPYKGFITLKDFIKSSVIIKIGELSITALLNDRIFIHQLGKRMFEKKFKKNYLENPIFNDASAQYQVVLTDFHYNFNKNSQQIIQYCEETLSEMDLILKYYKHAVSGKCHFYGIVSTKFIDSPQTKFREKLIYGLNASGLFSDVDFDNPDMKFLSTTSLFSPVKETFMLSDKVSNTFKMMLVVTYGLNNGYRSYSIYFNRKIELNGLILTPLTLNSLNSLVKGLIETKVANTYFEEFRHKNNHRFDFPDYVSVVSRDNFFESSTNWRNNPLLHENGQKNDMHNFIENMSIKLLLYTLFFEKRIKKAKETRYDTAKLESFFRLFRIANASKDRIKNKINELDNSLLSLSEAFRYIGSKEKAIGTSTKRFLIEIGSKFIDEDNYLNDTVKNGQEVALTGNYDFVDN